MVVPYGMPTESERGEDESLVLRMAEASSRRACTGAPSCDCWLSMRRMSNKSRREWHHGLVSSERDSASQGATLGQVLKCDFVYSIHSINYIEYSVVLAARPGALTMVPGDGIKHLQWFLHFLRTGGSFHD